MGHKALVTGSSRGIGAAAARRLAADGWDVTVHYNTSETAAKALAAELGTRAIKADVSDPKQVEALFAAAGPVDLLVCNAGVAEYGLLTDTDEDAWRHLLAVNTDGAYRCCRAAIPHMVHEKAGNIILVSSVWGVYGASCEAAYSASKAALIAWILGWSFWLCVFTAFVASCFGQVGDLAASLIKRMAGVKDYSHLMPGHGGIMDKMDGMLFSIPAAYFCLALFLPGVF